MEKITNMNQIVIMECLNKELLLLIKEMISNYRSLGYSATADYYDKYLTEKLKEFEVTTQIFNKFCSVCRIFKHIISTIINEDLDLVSKIRFEIHSGSMIDEETLEREIRNMIYYAPFDKYDMIWTLS